VASKRSGAIDMTIRRNAFGRQVDSFESDLSIAGSAAARTAACSSAPWACDEILAKARL